jgi:hypothetical protein
MNNGRARLGQLRRTEIERRGAIQGLFGMGRRANTNNNNRGNGLNLLAGAALNNNAVINQLANAPNAAPRNAQGAAVQRNLNRAIRAGNNQEVKQILRNTPIRRLSAVSWVVLVAALAMGGMAAYISRLARARAAQNWGATSANQGALGRLYGR